MNILVIGNGFDLAHGLPTKYPHFLEFCKRVFPIYENEEGRGIDLYQQEFLLEWDFNKEIKEALKNAYISRKKIAVEGNIAQIQTDYPRLDEMYSLIKDNHWIEYFLQYNMYQKENWIDFERVISDVIQSLDRDIEPARDIKSDRDIKPFGLDSNIQRISNEFLNEKYYESRSKLTYKMLRNILLDDLNKLTRALEIYLCEFVDKIGVKELPDIEALKIDHVLSFNYTNTFSKLYKITKRIGDTDSEIFDYIHGKADINNTMESNNMVLGIDEYLPDDRKDKDIEFIAFKKFYQRIYKQTGCKYKEWVDEIKEDYAEYQAKLSKSKNGYPKHNLYIFGHSLDQTDGDILRDLILNDNVKTTIFYTNREELGRKIANLNILIHQEELIRRTSGSTKTIYFVPQKN